MFADVSNATSGVWIYTEIKFRDEIVVERMTAVRELHEDQLGILCYAIF